MKASAEEIRRRFDHGGGVCHHAGGARRAGMDDHIAEMMKDGWEVVSTTNQPDSTVMIFKKG